MKKYTRTTFLVAMAMAATIAIGGCGSTDTSSSTKPATTASQQNVQKTTVSMYVPLDSGEGLQSKEITLTQDKNLVANALKAVLEADSHQKYPVFAKGTTVEKVEVSQGIANVYMSSAFLTGANQGHFTSSVRLASLVNTAMKCPGVIGVNFFANGKQVQSYGGYDLTKPLTWMKDVKIQ